MRGVALASARVGRPSARPANRTNTRTHPHSKLCRLSVARGASESLTACHQGNASRHCSLAKSPLIGLTFKGSTKATPPSALAQGQQSGLWLAAQSVSRAGQRVRALHTALRLRWAPKWEASRWQVSEGPGAHAGQAVVTRSPGLTPPSRGRPTSSFACCRSPLMSNVRRHEYLSRPAQ